MMIEFKSFLKVPQFFMWIYVAIHVIKTLSFLCKGKSGSTSGGSPKSTAGMESEGEEGIKSVESPGPKVPPLKIVIPSLESEQGTRNGKSGATRHHQALPYVVASASSSSELGDTQTPSTTPPPVQPSTIETDPSTPLSADEQRSHQRVLRSSHRLAVLCCFI